MTLSGPNPEDLETIAAFIDRRLRPEERKAFLERLDGEEELYEVFVETVRWREEGAEAEEGEDGRAEILPHPRATRWQWALPAAAAAALAMAVGVALFVVGHDGPGYREALLAGTGGGARLGEDWFEQPWSNPRSADPVMSETRTVFRIGVRVVDLDVALRLDRRGDVRALALRLEKLVASLDATELVRTTYLQLADRLAAGSDTGELVDLARSAEAELELRFQQAGAFHAFDLGRWAESGNLAARGGNESLLESAVFRGRIDELRGQATPETARDLLELRALLATGTLDGPRVEAAFRSILARY